MASHRIPSDLSHPLSRSLNDHSPKSRQLTPVDLRAARRIQVRSNGKTTRYNGQVLPGDRNDLYRFRIGDRSFFTASLRRNSQNVNLTLLSRTGQTIPTTNFPGTGLDVLLAPDLLPGVYYIRVLGRQGTTNYRLGLTARRNNTGGNVGDDGGVDPDGTGGTDGTTPTALFRDINPGRGQDSNPTDLTVVGNSLYFTADDGVNDRGRELFRVTGNGDPTPIIINSRPNAGSNPLDLVNVNGTLFFSADDGVNGRELFRIAGNATQATLVRDINSGTEGSNPRGLVNFNNTLYFAADGVLGRELYRSDGTTNGTVRAVDINPGADSSNPTDFAVVGNQLYFAADNGLNGRELFSTSGAQGNVNLVADLILGNVGSTGLSANSSIPTDLVNVNNVLYFAATGDIVGRELWRYDPAGGANAQPTVVSSIANGSASSNPGTDLSTLTATDAASIETFLSNRPNRSAIVGIGNTLYFAATGDLVGRELFRSDGTAGSTVVASAINAGGDSNPTNLTNINSVLFFAATGDAPLGNELYRFDPAQPNAGAIRVSDIEPGTASSNPAEFVVFNNNLVFAATTTVFGRELRFLPLSA